MTGHGLLLKRGCVISQDEAVGDLWPGDVLVEDGIIVDVAPSIERDDCEVIDAGGMIVMPGFSDGHRHTWQSIFRASVADRTVREFFGTLVPAIAPLMTPEDVYAANLAGAVDALEAGITTIVDWCHITLTPEHSRAAVDALEDSGIRAWFGHAPSLLTWDDRRRGHPEDIRSLRSERFEDPGRTVRLALAARGPAFTDLDVTARDFQLARELDLPITAHVSMVGYPPDDVKLLAREGLLGPDVALLHANAMSTEEITLAREAGCRFVDSSPLDVLMGIGPAITGRLLEAGVRPGISADTACANPTDLFWVMRAILLMERGRHYGERWERGEEASLPHLTTRDMLSLATTRGAESVWLDGVTGSISPGKAADLILLDGFDMNLLPLNDVVATVVLNATRSNVDTVLVAGRVVKRSGAMVSVDETRVKQLLLDTRDRLAMRAEAAGHRNAFGLDPAREPGRAPFAGAPADN